MGQIEIFEWLKKKRLTGDDNFFSPKQVYLGMIEDDCDIVKDAYAKGNVGVALAKLEAYGYLEVKVMGKWTDWQRRYRIREKYLKKI